MSAPAIKYLDVEIYMKPKILTFAGSIRQGSFNRNLAIEAAEALRAAGAEATFADLADYPMPLYDGDIEAAQGLPPAARAFKELVRQHDALAIASPNTTAPSPPCSRTRSTGSPGLRPANRRWPFFVGNW